MSDNICRLSVRLYDIMESAGVSEDMRRMYREWATHQEIMNTLSECIRNNRISHYIFGSSSEGTTTPDLNSDIDALYSMEDFPVIADIHCAPAGQSLLIVTDPDTKPGYVKLQHVTNGTPCTVSNSILLGNNLVADSRGRYCMKHKSHVGLLCGVNERNGPADTTSSRPGMTPTDVVCAFRCTIIPSFANKWLKQEGKYGWPSRKLLNRMEKQGCFFVGVGHPNSEERAIEWRMSFSLQEREIMFDLNPVQQRCYVLLKYIKNDLIKLQIGESISSYHCKTCLIYVMKATKQCLWKPDKLIKCVMICLTVLLKWTHDGFCPNVFVPSENMFERRVNGIVRTRLETMLRELLIEGYRFFFRIQCDCIGPMLSGTHIVGNDMIMQNCKAIIMQFRFEGRLHYCVAIHIRFFYLFISEIDQPLNALYRALAILNSIRTVTEHNEQDTASVISLLRPGIQLITAKYMASQTLHVRDAHQRRRWQWLSELYFKLGDGRDLMQSRLLRAAVLYRERQFDRCSLLLEEVASDIGDYLVSVCGCVSFPITGHEVSMKKMLTDNTFTHSLFLICVTFLPSEIELIPPALQYELHRTVGTPPDSWDRIRTCWFPWAVTDARIYMHFMQYLVYSNMNKTAHKQVAIDNIHSVMSTDHNLSHRETAYNLLGWIHAQEGRTQSAFTCFMESWKIRPHHNAAKWHVAILIEKCLYGRIPQ